MKKREVLHLKTECGQIGYFLGLWFLIFLGILLFACFQMMIFMNSSLYLEDALAASNLAAAVMDAEEYGRTHCILVDDPYGARQRFDTAVKGNLNLDENWECAARGMITGPVCVEQFHVYNVTKEDITIYVFSAPGVASESHGQPGNVTAPDGSLVESSGIYSELSYTLEGLFGISVRAHKGKFVDIVSNG